MGFSKRSRRAQKAIGNRWAKVREKKQLIDDDGVYLPGDQELTDSNEVDNDEMMGEVPVEEENIIVPKICLICCYPVPHKNKKYPTRIKFLLGQVVPYSLICDSHFRQEEIEQHIDLCSSCVRLLGQGEHLHGRIVKLEQELDLVKSNVKKLVQNSTLVKQEKDGGNLVVEKIYGNIRKQLLSDFVEEEDNFLVADWSGVDFNENEHQTENIFRPEIGNDPLEFEFGDDSVIEEVIANNSPLADLSIANSEFGEDSVVEEVGANSNSNIANSMGAIANSVVSSSRLEEVHRNCPEFQKLHRGKVMATYSKTTPKRSVGSIKISQLLKVKHKEKKSYTSKPAIENVAKIRTVNKPRSSASRRTQTGIFGHIVTPLKTGGHFNLPIFSEPMVLPVPEIRKLPDPTTPANGGGYPCAICPDKFDTLVDASLHRKYIHPGLSLCASPILSLQCGKIFRSGDMKRHRKESHPLVRCPECSESFTTTDRLESHVKTVHHPDGSVLPPLPEFGYDVKLIPWVLPLTREEIREAARDQGFFRVDLTRVEIKDTREHVVEQSIGDEELPYTSVAQIPDESQEIPETETAQYLSTTENLRILPTQPVKTKKKKIIIYNCGVCNTKFPVQSDLLQHLADAHNQTPKFGCFACLKEFTSLSECEAHVLSDHPDAKLPEQRVKLKKTRIISKIPENKYWMWPFMCKPCRLRFVSLPVLQDHMKSEEHAKTVELGGRLEICPRDGCKHKYRGQAELDSHLSEHVNLDKNFKCPQCHFKFADANLVLHHRVRCHKYVPTEAETLLPIVHPCREENCGKVFNHKDKLAKHMANTHGIGKYTCRQCTKVFSHLFRLNNHVKHVHEKVPGKYMCDICGKHFLTKYYLDCHRPIHGEERAFLCSECGKSFKTRISLTIHNYSHDPDRWTKHYPYRVLVEKRLQTQRKREAAAAAGANSGGPAATTKKRRRQSNISKETEIVDQFVTTEEEQGQM